MRNVLQQSQPLLLREDIESIPVFPIIHMVRTRLSLKDVTHFIDTPLTYEALTAPDLTYTLVHPLANKYRDLQHQGNKSIVFCLLLNRVHFIRDDNLTTSSLSRTRAHLCEILAIRCLREYGDNLLDLVVVAATSWPVYSGADPVTLSIAREENDELDDRVGNAIEMAIISKAKRFIKSTPCQKVIDAIWSGKCVYQADSSHSILSDTYKRTPVHFYNPHTAPLLDHYRLKVPAIRSVLEYLNFLILFLLFIVAVELNEVDHLNAWEVAFMIYSLGFSLEKVAAIQEHGIRVFFTGTWNGFDLAFIPIFCTYGILRIYGIFHPTGSWAKEVGIDSLALIACLLFPRLAFVTLKNNLMVLSLRAMITQFAFLMLIAVFCFAGFLYALWTLSKARAGYSVGQISWWMIDIWFGLDAAGFEKAPEFDKTFGPILMVTYACLSNTLLLTVLVSILSHTFSTISEDAAAEAMFRRAVSTIEGVKADSLFSYQPPVNLFALWVLLPASYVLTPRWFHKVNVFMIRLTNFPILITIAFYERQAKKTGTIGVGETLMVTTERFIETLPRNIKRWTFLENFMSGVGSDIDAIFELEEQLDSALDTHDQGALPSIEHQRSGSVRRTRGSNGSNNYSRMPSQSSMKPDSSPGRQGRHRVTTMLNRPGETMVQASPLAQLFQPLIMDEVIPEDAQPQTGTREGISYGPVTRRRLSSGTTLQKMFPSSRENESAIVQSPEDRSEALWEPETAEETEEKESTLGSLEWARRLDSIEKRQKRIEELLHEVLSGIRGSTGDNFIEGTGMR
ncbi:hypothetical protein B0F90DRAFT_1923547 [Multifurca ochricompacta]|uniref:Calcium channel YVC1 n=1 Tax=Multifurca ochricompacta TaxID=376703 RepID=A0AAD4QNF7_9AGAM|nr:hypothetical protein B0F90DRAFT_1923547 [Multifurca ochricompacta]